MLTAAVLHSQGLGRIVCGIRRALVLSLLLATFCCTSLYGQTRVYVCNANLAGRPESSSISVIDAASNTVIDTIPLTGFQAFFVAAAADGKHVYTAGVLIDNGFEGDALSIDTSTNTVVNQVELFDLFESVVAVSPDENLLLVGEDGVLAVINIPDNSLSILTIVGSVTDIIRGIVFAANGTQADVTVSSVSGGPSQTFIIDLTNGNIVGTLALSGNFLDDLAITNPGRIAFTPNRKTAYVAGQTGNTVSVFDVASGAVTKLIPVGQAPAQLALTPDGAFLYVTNFEGNSVSVISTASDTAIAGIPVGGFPDGIAIATLTTPFSEFKVKNLDIDRDNFGLTGSFKPGKGSTEVNPAKQDVILSIDDFSLTVPAGSFKFDQDHDNFHFKGRIKDVDVEFHISAEQSSEKLERRLDEFKFNVNARNVKVGKEANPVTVSLTIGNSQGTEKVNAH